MSDEDEQTSRYFHACRRRYHRRHGTRVDSHGRRHKLQLLDSSRNLKTMKLTSLALLSITSTSAFIQAPSRAQNRQWALDAVVTGPEGQAAASAEEDLALTLSIIMDHQARSTTVSKEQFIQQMEMTATVVDDPVVDVSVPYDATSLLAYEASDKSMPFEDFKTEYLKSAVELVKSKQPFDVTIDYDAAAKLAYASSDKSLPFSEFQSVYIAEAVAMVKSKQPIDVSVPYDAAAKLAYEASDKSMSFDKFNVFYLENAIETVKSKQPIDISVPYDAAAKLAYASSDKALPFGEFEKKYLADSVATVKAKQQS